jgi:membrane protein DedA with SNARE-associated domain
MDATMTGLLESYGYLGVFLLVGIESLGIPIPGETALVTAAAYAALGHLNIYGVVVVAAAGAILGDTIGYWIGRRAGLAAVRRWGRSLRVNASHMDRAHTFFQRHGGKTVFIGRFVALLRSWAAVLAGVGCMPYGAFLFYNATGGIVWAALFGTLGYVFGRNLPRLEEYIGQSSLAAAALIAVIALAALAIHRLRNRRSTPSDDLL